jgi:hypothetical protein
MNANGIEPTVRDALRRGDPAADGRKPTPAEVADWRRLVVASASHQPIWIPVRRPILALAATLALALAFGWQLLTTDTPPPPSERATTLTEEPKPRQLQFVAPGGTKVYWTLDPNFEL